jgi:hypothetical protein
VLGSPRGEAPRIRLRYLGGVTQSAILPSPSGDRRGVIGLLVLLFAITYLDRVCISVAGPRMQEDLGIDPIAWRWVTGMFTSREEGGDSPQFSGNAGLL